jgi:hypothetical protein
LVSLALFAVFLASSALAQDLIIYPAKGQSQEQMEKEKFECYTWAKQQTGFDLDFPLKYVYPFTESLS